jgi:hypothetical protein
VERPARGGVEAGGRLVQHDELRIVHECQCQAEPLPLAAGEGIEACVGFLGQAEAIDELRAGNAGGIKRGEEAEGLAGSDFVL